MKKLLIILLFLPSISLAQSQRNPCYYNTTGGCTPVSSSAPLPTSDTGQPTGAIAVEGNAVGSTGIIAATLAGVSSKTTYVCGFYYQGSNPTAAANVVIAITGIGALNGGFAYPTNAIGATTPQPPPLVITFSPCIPANAANTAIVFTASGLGAGATIASIASWGYQQ